MSFHLGLLLQEVRAEGVDLHRVARGRRGDGCEVRDQRAPSRASMHRHDGFVHFVDGVAGARRWRACEGSLEGDGGEAGCAGFDGAAGALLLRAAMVGGEKVRLAGVVREVGSGGGGVVLSARGREEAPEIGRGGMGVMERERIGGARREREGGRWGRKER